MSQVLEEESADYNLPDDDTKEKLMSIVRSSEADDEEYENGDD